MIQVAVDLDGKPISYAQVLQLWQMDAEFREMFNQILADCPYAAFRWETPPITTATADRHFEFVMLDSPGLARTPDATAFAEHFSPDRPVVEFANLGRDGVLVVPCPLGPANNYGHIGAFVRAAQQSQIHLLWQTIGLAMQRRLCARPVWLSTAGAGVSWLHVRLDDYPKYYSWHLIKIPLIFPPQNPSRRFS